MNPDRLAEAFVELADTLVDDFDVGEFLPVLTGRCAELAGVAAAGLLLAEPGGALRWVAASDERLRAVELAQLRTTEGPTVDAFASGAAVVEPDLAAAGRWPGFTASATAAGFAAVDAVPMRLRAQVIGALSLFRTAPGPLDPAALRTATALAEVATIGLLQQRSIHHHQLVAAQLQEALTSRVTIEQAKGKVAEQLGVEMDAAFAALRGYARAANLKLSEVAAAVVAGRTSAAHLLDAIPRRKPHRR